MPPNARRAGQPTRSANATSTRASGPRSTRRRPSSAASTARPASSSKRTPIRRRAARTRSTVAERTKPPGWTASAVIPHVPPAASRLTAASTTTTTPAGAGGMRQNHPSIPTPWYPRGSPNGGAAPVARYAASMGARMLPHGSLASGYEPSRRGAPGRPRARGVAGRPQRAAARPLALRPAAHDRRHDAQRALALRDRDDAVLRRRARNRAVRALLDARRGLVRERLHRRHQPARGRRDRPRQQAVPACRGGRPEPGRRVADRGRLRRRAARPRGDAGGRRARRRRPRPRDRHGLLGAAAPAQALPRARIAVDHVRARGGRERRRLAALQPRVRRRLGDPSGGVGADRRDRAVQLRDRDPQGRARRRGRPPLRDRDVLGAPRRAPGVRRRARGADARRARHGDGRRRAARRREHGPARRRAPRGRRGAVGVGDGRRPRRPRVDHALLPAGLDAVLRRVRDRRRRLPGRLTPVRSIQHKAEAYWFYRVVSLAYDRWINPLFWTEPMRDTALALGRLDRRDLDVVDVGAGTGFTTSGIVRAVAPERVTMIDQSPHQLARAKRKHALDAVEKRIGDAESLPLQTDSVDRYVSAGSIEYWPDPQRAIAEAYRVLRPGGVALVIGPLRRTHPLARRLSDAWMLFPDDGEYTAWMERAGFTDLRRVAVAPPWWRAEWDDYGVAIAGVKAAAGPSPAAAAAASRREARVERLGPARLARFALGSLAGAAFIPVALWFTVRERLARRR